MVIPFMVVEGLAGRREDGGGSKWQSNPNAKGLLCRGPCQGILEMGQSWVWRLQTETQQMGLTFKRGQSLVGRD